MWEYITLRICQVFFLISFKVLLLTKNKGPCLFTDTCPSDSFFPCTWTWQWARDSWQTQLFVDCSFSPKSHTGSCIFSSWSCRRLHEGYMMPCDASRAIACLHPHDKQLEMVMPIVCICFNPVCNYHSNPNASQLQHHESAVPLLGHFQTPVLKPIT